MKYDDKKLKENGNKQYFVRNYNFKNIREDKKKDRIYFDYYKDAVKNTNLNQENVSDKDDLIYFGNADNLFYDVMYRITNKEYQLDLKQNRIEEIFVLRANDIDSIKDKEEKEKYIKLYKKATQEGIYIDNQKYVWSEKSASFVRTQKTIFIREDLKDIVEEYVTLGTNKKIKSTVLAKYLSTKGLLLSSADLVPIIPNICVIPDMKRDIAEDVRVVKKFEPITEDKKLEQEKYEKEKKKEQEKNEKYWEKVKEIREKHGDNYQKYLRKNYKCPNLSYKTYKSVSGWDRENKRVKLEELENFTYIGHYKEFYPVYHKDQTEDKKIFPIDKYSLGYDVVGKSKEEQTTENEAFDGAGLASIEFMNKLEKHLGQKDINGFQGRLPFVKGLFIKFDFKKYIKEELNTTQITDIFGDVHNIDDIDMIVTQSCFKDNLNIDKEGNKSHLFENMQDYYSRLKYYGYDKMGVTNYAKPLNKLKDYIQLSYQAINSLDLTAKDLGYLSRTEGKLIQKAKYGDIESIKKILNMVGNIQDNEEDDILEEKDTKTKIDYILEAIEINPRIIYEKEVEKFIHKELKKLYMDMMIGKITIAGRFLYITGDPISFCEWAVYQENTKAKGFLNKGEFYCNGVEGKQVMLRYPLVHFSQIALKEFIQLSKKDTSYQYLKHLDNIIIFNGYDLTNVRLAGADFDGDSVSLLDASMPVNPETDKLLKDCVIKGNVLVDPGVCQVSCRI